MTKAACQCLRSFGLMRNRAIDAELAIALRLPRRTWTLGAASMGLRLADVTEMPTLRVRRHLSHARQ